MGSESHPSPGTYLLGKGESVLFMQVTHIQEFLSSTNWPWWILFCFAFLFVFVVVVLMTQMDGIRKSWRGGHDQSTLNFSKN